MVFIRDAWVDFLGVSFYSFLLLMNISFVAAAFLFLFLPFVNPFSPLLSQRLKLEECWSHVIYVCMCVCARANPQLAAALNEQSGFGMHRSLLLCALQQAPERKW